MREALFYKKTEHHEVQCGLCPHYCRIKEKQRGICGVRENIDGVLQSLVYGKVVASHVDPIEKKPLFHFLPGSYSFSIATAGCNFRCDFCQNWQISMAPREYKIIPGENWNPEEVVAEAVERECQSISYTYTEPTVYFEFALDCAKLARARGLKNVFVTNGFTSPEAVRLVAPFLDAANIDLKSFREEYYRKICGGSLAPVIASIKLIKELGIWIELTTLVIPGLNDSAQELQGIAEFIKNELGEGVPWHVSAFFPTHKMLDRLPTPEETLVRAREIGLTAGLQHVYCGNLLVPEAANTYCGHCGKTVITRSGHRVTSSEIKDGQCAFCGHNLPGVFR